MRGWQLMDMPNLMNHEPHMGNFKTETKMETETETAIIWSFEEFRVAIRDERDRNEDKTRAKTKTLKWPKNRVSRSFQ